MTSPYKLSIHFIIWLHLKLQCSVFISRVLDKREMFENMSWKKKGYAAPPHWFYSPSPLVLHVVTASCKTAFKRDTESTCYESIHFNGLNDFNGCHVLSNGKSYEIRNKKTSLLSSTWLLYAQNH